jgi:hypothetical protein
MVLIFRLAFTAGRPSIGQRPAVVAQTAPASGLDAVNAVSHAALRADG